MQTEVALDAVFYSQSLLRLPPLPVGVSVWEGFYWQARIVASFSWLKNGSASCVCDQR